MKNKEFLPVSPIFTKGILANLNELESESDIFPQNEGQSWQIWIDPSKWALTYSALTQIFPKDWAQEDEKRRPK